MITHEIIGDDMQAVVVSMATGDEIRAEAGAMTYMMSRQQYLNDDAHSWMPHLMFYFPRADGANWGADLPGAPPMLNAQFQDSPEAISVIMVAVKHWSDGTPAPMMR